MMITIYSITHFLVDFACAYMMFKYIADTPAGYLCVLLYNFFAFAMQMPIGIVADKLNRNYLVAAIGCILVSAAYALIPIPIASVVVIGLGNAMFHIGGGVDVLNMSERKLGALGVFVSPGAYGVYLGTLLAKDSGIPTVIIPAVVFAAAAVIFVRYRMKSESYQKNSEFTFTGVATTRSLAVISCFFLVVCLRSFVGLTLDFTWKSYGYWGVALISAVVLGKTAGGFAADRIGIHKTAVISLGIAVLMFLFPAQPPLGVAAVFLFNMTMPITLWAMARMMPGAKGFAFGLLTFGIFVGFIPVYLGINVSKSVSWLFALLSAVSLAMLWVGLRKGLNSRIVESLTGAEESDA